jgi:hypothetical protein
LAAAAGDNAVWWQSDYSMVKSMDRDVVKPVRWVDEQTAKVLLRPLL